MNVDRLEALVTRYRELDHERRPSVVGVLGDFSGDIPDRPKVKERRFADVRWESFGAFLAAVRPRLALNIPDCIGGESELSIELAFERLEDFQPQVLRHRVLADAAARKSEGLGQDEFTRRLHEQLNAILHHDKFRRLAASWYGLHHLVTQLSGGSQLRIRVLDIAKRELGKELRKFKGLAWDKSTLFKMIYEHEFGTFGGHPFNLVIGDYEFSHQPADVETLGEMGMIVAASQAVFLTSAAPQLFGESDFAGAIEMREPGRLFQAAEYAQWRALCESAQAQHLALVLPRVLLRAPYHSLHSGSDGFAFQEHEPAGLWGNPAYVVGAELMNAFARHRGLARLEDLPGGGVIAGLPLVDRAIAGRVVKSCLEQQFAPRLRAQLESAGFIPLFQRGQSERVSFARGMSLAVNGDLSGDQYDLATTMLIGRVSHGLRSWGRTLCGTTSDPMAYAAALEAWLRREAAPSDTADLAGRIRHPLREIRLRRDFDQRQLERFPLDETLQVQIDFKPHSFDAG